MLTALTVTPSPARRRFLRRATSTRSRLVKVEGGHYLQILACPDRRGRLDWREIARLAGNEATRLLLPRGLCPPPDGGVLPFRGQALQQVLLCQTAQALLTAVPGLSRRTVVIDDPHATHTPLAEALIPLTAHLRILTRQPAGYAATAERVMDTCGAVLPITTDPLVYASAGLVLAPDGPSRNAPNRRGWVLSGRMTAHPRSVTGYVPLHGGDYLRTLPPGCDIWGYLAGLFEHSGIHRLGNTPPRLVCAGNRTLSIKELSWQLAGLDIGLSV